MKQESWDNVFGEVPASFEERMRATLATLEETPKIRRFRFPRAGLIAAALLVVVLGGTALATNLFGLKSLTVADPYATPEAVGDVIALQGLPESREFLANSQWMEYLAGMDLAQAASASDVGQLPERYALYTVYNTQMADALDRITQANSLRLHTSRSGFYSQEQLCAAIGAQPFIDNCAAINGYIYEDGSFQGAGTSMGDKCYEYELGRYVKGSFSEVTLYVGNAGEYEEWMYTNAHGTEMQLSMGPDRCVLLADLPDSFIAINLLGGTAGNSVFMPEPVSQSDLETFADFFDFSSLD